MGRPDLVKPYPCSVSISYEPQRRDADKACFWGRIKHRLRGLTGGQNVASTPFQDSFTLLQSASCPSYDLESRRAIHSGLSLTKTNTIAPGVCPPSASGRRILFYSSNLFCGTFSSSYCSIL